MSKSVGKKKKRKMNSYLKMGLWMLAGAVVGGIFGRVSSSSEHTMVQLLSSISSGIAKHLFVIVTTLAVAEVILCLVSYRKAEKFIKLAENCEEEDEERMEFHFEVWSTIEIMASQIPMFLCMMFLGFLVEAQGMLNKLGTMLPFIIIVAVSGIFQVAPIKQVQRKDPSKRGDPSDIRFDKDWLESCDEAERAIIYQASYKTFNFMKMVLLFGMVVALMAQFVCNIGVAPVLFIGMIYIMMLIVYSVYSMRLRESKLND